LPGTGFCAIAALHDARAFASASCNGAAAPAIVVLQRTSATGKHAAATMLTCRLSMMGDLLTEFILECALQFAAL
jgi:hypothetical protein